MFLARQEIKLEHMTVGVALSPTALLIRFTSIGLQLENLAGLGNMLIHTNKVFDHALLKVALTGLHLVAAVDQRAFSMGLSSSLQASKVSIVFMWLVPQVTLLLLPSAVCTSAQWPSPLGLRGAGSV